MEKKADPDCRAMNIFNHISLGVITVHRSVLTLLDPNSGHEWVGVCTNKEYKGSKRLDCVQTLASLFWFRVFPLSQKKAGIQGMPVKTAADLSTSLHVHTNTHIHTLLCQAKQGGETHKQLFCVLLWVCLLDSWEWLYLCALTFFSALFWGYK